MLTYTTITVLSNTSNQSVPFTHKKPSLGLSVIQSCPNERALRPQTHIYFESGTSNFKFLTITLNCHHRGWWDRVSSILGGGGRLCSEAQQQMIS